MSNRDREGDSERRQPTLWCRLPVFGGAVTGYRAVQASGLLMNHVKVSTFAPLAWRTTTRHRADSIANILLCAADLLLNLVPLVKPEFASHADRLSGRAVGQHRVRVHARTLRVSPNTPATFPGS